MKSRVIVMALMLSLATACDVNKRDGTVQQEAEAAAPASKGAHPPARQGVVMIGQSEYPFDVQLCSLKAATEAGRFMLTGSGKTAEGQRFSVNADGAPGITAVVVRLLNPLGSPVQSYSASFGPAHIDGEARTIAAAGSAQTGHFSASCSRGAELAGGER